VSRVFSGRAGRRIATAYARAATAPDAPHPAPYPVQRGLTTVMREVGTKANDIDRIHAWAGQSVAMARTKAAGDVVRSVWDGARQLLG
jgi:nitronate monooxygenase